MSTINASSLASMLLTPDGTANAANKAADAEQAVLQPSTEGVKVSLSAAGLQQQQVGQATSTAGAGELPKEMQEILKQLQELQQQLSDLLTQVAQVMANGSLSPDEKVQQAAPLNQAIASLQAQMMQLLSTLMKMLDTMA